MVHLDIIDYPGEWLLDLDLLERSYDDWSAEILARAESRPSADGFRAALAKSDPAASFSETEAVALAAAYTAYLRAARAEGFSDCTPGRFLMPGEMAGLPRPSPSRRCHPCPAVPTARRCAGRWSAALRPTRRGS